jgi:GntR family transcriptional regulator
VALRNWLAPGRYRPGDRLPPELDVAAMLGVSRGTLRTALGRLEQTGDIVRRQGSGTFVGAVKTPRAFDERLERLVPYSAIAKRRGVVLSARELTVQEQETAPEFAECLGLRPGTHALTISRILLADGDPVAAMFDVVHPAIELNEGALRRAIESGQMLLDVLIGRDVPIAFARTRVMPRLLTAREPTGRALGVRRATAVLELEEIYHSNSGEVIACSRDLFAPQGIDVRVIRSLDASRPSAIAGHSAAASARRRRPRSAARSH